MSDSRDKPQAGKDVSKMSQREMREEIRFARKLLEVAVCPDDNCDKAGTCSRWPVPGYDGEADIDVWECQWCAERNAVLGRDGSSAPIADIA